jgi:hypothetical protein
MCEITIGSIPRQARLGVGGSGCRSGQVYLTGAPVARREIWIHWGGKDYGPYRDAAHARQDGFHLPEEHQ